jgi:hypothetical protein
MDRSTGRTSRFTSAGKSFKEIRPTWSESPEAMTQLEIAAHWEQSLSRVSGGFAPGFGKRPCSFRTFYGRWIKRMQSGSGVSSMPFVARWFQQCRRASNRPSSGICRREPQRWRLLTSRYRSFTRKGVSFPRNPNQQPGRIPGVESRKQPSSRGREHVGRGGQRLGSRMEAARNGTRRAKGHARRRSHGTEAADTPALRQWAVTRLEQADTAQLEAWSERIFDARTLEELLRRESGRE